jgi:hypothetical protein
MVFHSIKLIAFFKKCRALILFINFEPHGNSVQAIRAERLEQKIIPVFISVN